MCKFNQCLRTFCKRSTKIHAICVNLTTQYVWAWVNFDHNLRCLLKDLCTQQKFYASASRTGRNKYHGWTPSKSENMAWTTKRQQQRQKQRQWQMHLEREHLQKDERPVCLLLLMRIFGLFSCPQQLNRWPCPLLGPSKGQGHLLNVSKVTSL